MDMKDKYLFDEEAERVHEDTFHIEADIFDTGDYSSMLVVPCGNKYIIILNDEHLCTMEHTGDEPDCWELVDGNIDEELMERIGAAIKGYTV